MKKLKVVSLIVVLALVFSACKSKTQTQTDETKTGAQASTQDGKVNQSNSSSAKKYIFPLKEPVTMSMFGSSIAVDHPLNEIEAFKEIEKRTNVFWDVQCVTSTELKEKRGIVLSTGQYPEVLMKSGVTADEIVKYGSEGIFIDLKDYIKEYAPNLTKLMKEDPSIAYTITTLEGNIYSLPGINRESVGFTGWNKFFLNTKWLDNLGLKYPETVEEFVSDLRAFKEKDANKNGDLNDEIPILISSDNIFGLLSIYGIIADVQNSHCMLEEDKLGEYLYTSDQYKGFLAFVRDLYQEGLLYTDVFVANRSQVQAIAKSGNVAGSFIHSGCSDYLSGNDYSLDYDFLLPFEGKKYPVRASSIAGGLVITDKCKDPALVVAWADQLYTEEYSRMIVLGIEGKSYEVEDGKYPNFLVSREDLEGYKFSGGAGQPFKQPEISYKYNKDPKIQIMQTHNEKVSGTGLGIFAPQLKYNEKDGKRVAQINADIIPYVEQYLAQVATGDKDLDSTWNDYVATLKNMGCEEYYDLTKKAFDFYLENK